MAVEDKFANTLLDSSSRLIRQNLNAIFSGMKLSAAFARVEIAAADSDTSEFILWRDMDPCIIPLMILLATDGLTAGTVWDVGLFGPSIGDNPGDVIATKGDCFANNLDFSSAVASLNPKTALDGMSAVALDNYEKMLYEHAGHTIQTKKSAYSIGLTGATIGSAAGGIHGLLIYAAA